MSTKIYNGYISNLNLFELLEKFKDLSKIFNEIKITKYNEYLIERGVFEFDKKYKNDKNSNLKEIVYNLWEKDYKFIIDEVISKSRRCPDIDLSASCSVFPHENKTLILFYCENSEITKYWESLDYIHDYHYQNSSDKPEKISEDDWDKRRKDWDIVLGGDGWAKPMETGYVFKFTDEYIPVIYLTEKLDKYIPTDESRANKVLSDMFIENKIKELQGENKFEYNFFFTAKELWFEYKKTKEYQEEIQEISKSLIRLGFCN